jgi:hypothetical protein
MNCSKIDTTEQQRPNRRSLGQQRLLQTRNRHHVPDLGSRVPPRDIVYVRPAARGHEAKSPNAVLLESLLYLHTRRGCAWNETDATTMSAVRARSWQFSECVAVATDHVPRWLSDLVPGRLRARVPLAYCALAAHRAGALGVLLSYTEIAALFDVSERTAGRWVKELEAAEILEVVQTWQESPKGCSVPRGYWKQLYRPGPKMRHVAGMGMCEGARDLSDAEAALARRIARVARARSRERIRLRSDALWTAKAGRRPPVDEAEATDKTICRRDDGGCVTPDPQTGGTSASVPSSLSLDTKSTPPPPTGGRGIQPPSSRRQRVLSVAGLRPSAPVGAEVRTGTAEALQPKPAGLPGAQAPGQCNPRAIDGPDLLTAWLERATPKRRRPALRDVSRCPVCHGGGYSDGIGSPPCPRCGGSGSS